MLDAEKDPIAQAMAAKRWDNATPEERRRVGKVLNDARWAGHVKAGRKKKVGKAKAGEKGG